ncbi:hypothetical protein FAI40_10395 (plasmid) [Acetobacteraceae bacterium]|nr:hypothetical protein FAI40_10395 [Acetobacteraceae bacterium]
MSKSVFIVPHPAHSTGKPVEHHEVKKAGGEVLHKTKTQKEAIDWAKEKGHVPHVAREKETKPDPNNPEHWRKV